MGRTLLHLIGAAGFAFAAAGSPALAQSVNWTRTWEAVAVSAPNPPATPPALAATAPVAATAPAATVAPAAAPAPARTAPSLTNITVRMPLRISAGGSQLRLRLSNELSATPLTLGAVHVAMLDAAGAIVPGSDRVVSFSGAGSATIPPNAPLVSDPVNLTVPALAHLAVSLYLPGDASLMTLHSAGGETGQIGPGDQTAAAAITGGRNSQTRYVLTGVEVAGGGARSTLVTLGDSITEGAKSTPDTDRRWPDTLAERLNAAKIPVAVANAGISGNRLLLNGSGPDILARLDRDVLSAPNLKYVIVLEAINDIGHGATGDMPTVDQITAIYNQIIQRAHDRGVKVIGGTVLPYKGAGYATDAGEVVRQGVNAWIRAPGHFDGVIDFDKATSDPANPSVMLPAYDSGDHLHPNDPGNAAMAQAIDLKLFN